MTAAGGPALTVHIAFLDQYADTVTAQIQRHLPRDWTATTSADTYGARLTAVRDAHAILTGWTPVDARLIANAKRVRIIHKLGAGVDKIDVDACRARGIAVARLAGANAVPVAEHIVLLILATMRRLPIFDRRTREGGWLKEQARGRNRQLCGKRVGLVGLGHVGRAVAQRLNGFDIELVYFDTVPAQAVVERRFGLTWLPIDELLTTSDVVSLQLPLTDSTRNLLDADELSRMKDGAVLVNCGRGGLVDETALAAELASGRLAGAGLDVFAIEPPTNSPLLQLDTTVVTPHMAGATVDNFSSVLDRALENIRAVLGGAPLPPEDAVVQPRISR
jgi:phosphoglycerate dehydrogenase-like enzyme